LTFIVGLIHLALTPEHLEEASYLGLLFLANFVGAATAALGIFRGRRWGWALGALVAGGTYNTPTRIASAIRCVRPTDDKTSELYPGGLASE
jgi:hypothetical protein